ncbi:homoserine acetyltransferase [Streptacidiphilus sp. MAP12-33]|uniref:hypothetical protein n=1 Tax=Streptacidiphilus sp. MAP12-33 TaxID=3156266 RepID=UPI003518A7DD
MAGRGQSAKSTSSYSAAVRAPARSTVLTDGSPRTGVYYDETGKPMRGSAQVHDLAFQDRVVRETRALLATV